MEALILSLLQLVPQAVDTLNQLKAAGQITNQNDVDAALAAAMASLATDFAKTESDLDAAAKGS